MALIKCPDCGNQVSDRAPTCPKCGAPIAGREETIAIGASLTTIQETSKRLKAQIVMSSVCFWVGLLWIVVIANATQSGEKTSLAIPILLSAVGLIWYLTTRFRIWWHHK